MNTKRNFKTLFRRSFITTTNEYSGALWWSAKCWANGSSTYTKMLLSKMTIIPLPFLHCKFVFKAVCFLFHRAEVKVCPTPLTYQLLTHIYGTTFPILKMEFIDVS